MSTRMPVLFIGHGSPMNALEDNAFTRALNGLGEKIQRPQAILCVSAHWMTEGTWITSQANPRTIHDFYGFPQKLFDVQYPAPGFPGVAANVRAQIKDPQIILDKEMWGFDHGTWSVLKHMYPKAEVPVLQLSIHIEQPGEYHFKLGQELRKLREQGILIIGSGNIVHNLRQIRWEPQAKPYDWAIEFDEWTKMNLMERNFKPLVEDYLKSEAGRMGVPTPDHYYPFLYSIAASDDRDELKFEYEGIDHGSISMRCVSFGLN